MHACMCVYVLGVNTLQLTLEVGGNFIIVNTSWAVWLASFSSSRDCPHVLSITRQDLFIDAALHSIQKSVNHGF